MEIKEIVNYGDIQFVDCKIPDPRIVFGKQSFDILFLTFDLDQERVKKFKLFLDIIKINYQFAADKECINDIQVKFDSFETAAYICSFYQFILNPVSDRESNSSGKK